MIRYMGWVLISSDSETGSVALGIAVLEFPQGSDGSKWVTQIVWKA